jgi:hypothetical protein
VRNIQNVVAMCVSEENKICSLNVRISFPGDGSATASLPPAVQKWGNESSIRVR